MINPSVIPYLKKVHQHEYDNGYFATSEAIVDAIEEFERLDDISQALHRENQHLRAINQRMVETLVEIAPLKKYIIYDDTNSSRQSAIIGNGGDSSLDAKPPAKATP